MGNWTVRTRIIAGFAAVIAITLALAAWTYHDLTLIRGSSSELADDVLPSVVGSSHLRVLSSDLARQVQLEAKAADAAERAAAHAEATRILAEMDRAESEFAKAIFIPDERQRFEAVVAAQRAFADAYDRTSTAGAGAGSAGTALPALLTLEDRIDTLTSWNNQRGHAAGKAIQDDVAVAERNLIIASIIALIIAVLATVYIVRGIQQPLARLMTVTESMGSGDFRQRVQLGTRDELGLLGGRVDAMANDLTQLIGQVQQSGIKVNSSATEIAATAKEQQSTAAEIAATTVEVGATASRISATAAELVQTMNEVADVAEQTAALATSGQGGLQRMETSMRQIIDASASINSRLALLSEKAGSIGTVVTTINKVADQTNLLSLNAAIEAEKAGEHGRGFSVVATEIRRLADQTAVATYDIEQIVKEMQSAVAAGVMGMDKFSEEVRRGAEVVGQVTNQLNEIIQQVQALTPRFETANEGVQSQSVSAQQISEALSQLSVAAQQTADSLRQSNIAIEDLTDAARGLQGGISRFTLAAR